MISGGRGCTLCWLSFSVECGAAQRDLPVATSSRYASHSASTEGARRARAKSDSQSSISICAGMVALWRRRYGGGVMAAVAAVAAVAGGFYEGAHSYV